MAAWQDFWLSGWAPASSFTAAVTQAAASTSSTLREDFRVAATVAQGAGVIAATLREDFRISTAATQAAAALSATAREAFRSTAAVSQAAASPALNLREDFRLSVGVDYLYDGLGNLIVDQFDEAIVANGSTIGAATQAAASLSATVREAFQLTTAMAQPAAAVSGSLAAVEAHPSFAVTISQAAGSVAGMLTAPVVSDLPNLQAGGFRPQQAETSTFHVGMTQAAARVSIQLEYSDDELAMLLLAA